MEEWRKKLDMGVYEGLSDKVDMEFKQFVFYKQATEAHITIFRLKLN